MAKNIIDCVAESNLNRDVLSVITIDEPEVLRKLHIFDARHSGTILNHRKNHQVTPGRSSKNTHQISQYSVTGIYAYCYAYRSAQVFQGMPL